MARKGVDPKTKDWFAYKMNSRKWLLMMGIAALFTVLCYTLVALLNIYSSTIVETVITSLERVTIAYFGLNVVQKLGENWERVKTGKSSEDTEE
jgi:hypothetical protein